MTREKARGFQATDTAEHDEAGAFEADVVEAVESTIGRIVKAALEKHLVPALEEGIKRSKIEIIKPLQTHVSNWQREHGQALADAIIGTVREGVEANRQRMDGRLQGLENTVEASMQRIHVSLERALAARVDEGLRGIERLVLAQGKAIQDSMEVKLDKTRSMSAEAATAGAAAAVEMAVAATTASALHSSPRVWAFAFFLLLGIVIGVGCTLLFR